MLELEENDDQMVLSQWSESSKEVRQRKSMQKFEPVGDHFKKEKRVEEDQSKTLEPSLMPIACKELSKKLMSPELKQMDSSVGFDTFNPSKKQSTIKESGKMMNSIVEEDSKLQSNKFTTNDFANSLYNPLNSIQFMTKTDGYELKKMPRISTVLKNRNTKTKTPKWKRHLLNLRKRKQKRKRIQNKHKIRLKLKKPMTQKMRKRQIRKTKRRNKLKVKKMLKNYLIKFPWKNKRLFNHRNKAIKDMKRYGTMPGSRLFKSTKKENLMPDKYYKNWEDKSYKMWSIKGSPLMKKDIYRSASVGGKSKFYEKSIAKSENSKKSTNIYMWQI